MFDWVCLNKTEAAYREERSKRKNLEKELKQEENQKIGWAHDPEKAETLRKQKADKRRRYRKNKKVRDEEEAKKAAAEKKD
ncbi:hypothetical protein VKT23_008701 [Stygiomarasmius scandens]|uniref:Uncharacterized protein n=1 Tax=Marasmiellus scandens TaxID=2682957 RepID=A0ABR1JI11_9AGAR